MAAHRTYPFGTVVRVTNLGNRRSLNVVIVDRGPYGKNRREGAIIDLSRAAAEKLGIIKRGRARVKLEVLVWGDGQYRKKAAGNAIRPAFRRGSGRADLPAEQAGWNDPDSGARFVNSIT
jgi:rare lipoprotein A